MKGGQNGKWSKWNVVTSSQNEKWSKWNVVKMESGQNGKGSK